MGLVLVVDDEQLVAETLVEVLVWDGHEVLTASNGEDALALVDARVPDILVIDFMMPIMDGVEALRELRARERQRGTPRVPTILMTAAPSGVPLGEDLFDVLLTKPFNVTALRAAMTKAFAPAPR